MEIRDAAYEDFPQVLKIMRAVHRKSIFKDIEMNDAVIQRHFVVAIHFDDGYAKVVECRGKIVGFLGGMVADNHFGIRCAQDLFNFSLRGTDRLIRDFTRWAEGRGAQFIQVTDMTDNPRYRQLCLTLQMRPSGTNFAKVA